MVNVPHWIVATACSLPALLWSAVVLPKTNPATPPQTAGAVPRVWVRPAGVPGQVPGMRAVPLLPARLVVSDH
jgi:hypothetical protein